MKNKLKEFLETNLLSIATKDYALSISVEDYNNNNQLKFIIILNAEDNESKLLKLFISFLYNFYFVYNYNPIKLNYQINMQIVDSCTELIIFIKDENNFK